MSKQPGVEKGSQRTRSVEEAALVSRGKRSLPYRSL